MAEAHQEHSGILQKPNNLPLIQVWLSDNQYDTDAIKYDLDDPPTSNISDIIDSYINETEINYTKFYTFNAQVRPRERRNKPETKERANKIIKFLHKTH